MLMNTPTTTVHPRQHQEPICITGNQIAKAKIDKRERARWAARWWLDNLAIDPTVAMAARTFGASEYRVRQAIDVELKSPTAPEPEIDTLWAAMPAADRDRFVDEHLPDLWERFDRATCVTAA
jgi:hypothetical protein